MASSDALPDHPPSGDGGYKKWMGFERRFTRSSTIWHALPRHALQVATAAKRWFGFERSFARSSTIWRWWLQEDGLASSDASPAHPPSGDGGYKKWMGFDRRSTTPSTIWRWWLREDGWASGGDITTHPPSGTHSSRSHRCQAVDSLRATSFQIIHHLAVVATRRWFGFGWRHNNASTIWYALPRHALLRHSLPR